MTLETELASYMSDAPRTGRRHTDDFFRRFGLDKAKFEAFSLRRFPAGGEAYYVSTVPRGLAGPTSDIDLILVTEEEVSADQATSNMLFFEGRRTGVKMVDRGQVAACLGQLGQGSPRRIWNDAKLLDRLPLKFIDLERLVNGVAVGGQDAYLTHLPLLSAWAASHHLRHYVRGDVFTRLALRAGADGAAWAYAQEALQAAMDWLMARCGRVQWNPKWTFQRWSAFVAEISSAEAREGVAVIEALRRTLHEGGDEPEIRSACDAVVRLAAASDAMAASCPILTPAERAATFRFLPGATSLSLDERTSIVPDDLLAELRAAQMRDVGAVSRGAARAGLELVQRGFFSLAFEEVPA